MAIKVHYEKTAPIDPIKDSTVAVIGYGSQGHAHAQNLRDSGIKVLIGNHNATSANAKLALSHGFTVVPPADAVRQADIVMCLVPDEFLPEVYEADIAPNLRPGMMLMTAHGFNIHFGFVKPPKSVDVTMIAPKGPGHTVRSEFVKGGGVPCLVAVKQNATKKALQRALAYGNAIGGARAGIIETTFRDETETDQFGEQAVLCGGASELVQAGFDTLVEAGYDPQMAYFECLHELKLIVDLMYEKGLAGMRYSISNTAEYGDYTRGKRVITDETRENMKKILGEIQDGTFAREWIAENRAGQENFKRLRDEQAKGQIEVTGKELRAKMDWIQTEF